VPCSTSYDVHMWHDVTRWWHNAVMTTAPFHNLPSIEGEGEKKNFQCHTCNSLSGLDPSLLLAITTLRESKTSDAVIRSWGSRTNRRWISAIVPSDTLPSLWENKHNPLMIRSCEMWQCLTRFCRITAPSYCKSSISRWQWRHLDLLKHEELLTQWHSIISHEILIFRNAWTSNLTRKSCSSHDVTNLTFFLLMHHLDRIF